MSFRLTAEGERLKRALEPELSKRIKEKLDNYPYEEDWGNSWDSLDSAKKAAYIEDVQERIYAEIEEDVMSELFLEKSIEKHTEHKTNKVLEFLKNVLGLKSQQKTDNKNAIPSKGARMSLLGTLKHPQGKKGL